MERDVRVRLMDWHKRFLQQAGWTAPLRRYLFEKANLRSAQRVLEVGCGTGAILAGLETTATIHAVDLLPDRLVQAHLHAPRVQLACADVLRLPYGTGIFDVTFCHYLLLWVLEPLQALREMKRVTRPGGSILVLAEPDYNARRDEPAELAPLGRWQTESLRRQGADPGMGAKLAGLFAQAGIPCRETGILQASLQSEPSPGELALEWEALESDLAGLVSAREIRRLKRFDRAAWQRHARLLYVPTYWAFGISGD